MAVVACVLLATGVASAGGVKITFTPGADGAGDPYFPLDGNGGYDTQHYFLDLQYDPATDVIGGSATIRARATQDLSRFNLDLEGLDVHSVEVNNRDATWSRNGGELVITPSKGIRRHHLFITKVVYSGVPEPIVDAFGVSGFIHTDDGAMIIGEPHVADTWYPVNDHPSDKASYTFRIRVPAGLEAVANGCAAGRAHERRVDNVALGRPRADGVLSHDRFGRRVRVAEVLAPSHLRPRRGRPRPLRPDGHAADGVAVRDRAGR